MIMSCVSTLPTGGGSLSRSRGLPRLVTATAASRANWQLLGDGEGIHWPDTDEDLSVAGCSPAPRAPAQEPPDSERAFRRRACTRATRNREPRATQPLSGDRIVQIPEVGGLHHHYEQRGLTTPARIILPANLRLALAIVCPRLAWTGE